MKISIRKKIIITFSLFLVIGVAVWLLNYYKQQLLYQKLQILEKKEDLLNTILEARRHEKNYFLYMGAKNLEDSLTYAHQAEEKLVDIIENYGRYTLDRNLANKLDKLRQYEKALSALLVLHQKNGSPVTNPDLIETFARHQEAIRTLARNMTEDMEKILNQERRYVNQLIGESKIYHLLALAGILALAVLTVLFFFFNVNRPLKSIENGIHKIVEGDYKNIPAISTGDEFESLVASLNNMISELHKRSEQLIQSEKMASLGTLTSGVAHELNNPLNNISTSVQILLEELEDADLEYKKELLTQTEGQIERARDIVRALLEFSRKRSFSLQRIYFLELVDNTLKLIRGEVPANVRLTVDVPVDLLADMDPRRIEQVLINLILNGIQAMPDGGILSIRACRESNESGFCFEVSDTGKGIPPQNLAKLFDPFFTTKDVGKGSGLGLSVSHGIIEQHGGRIEVKSQVAKGTTFSVFLPSPRPEVVSGIDEPGHRQS
ncbi:MAG: ATP-binding protein [Desulfobacterales bacterium]